MNVKQLIERLERIENKSLPVLIDDPFGSESWRIDGDESVRYIPGKCVFIQVGERFDSDDEDHEDADEAWHKFLDDSALQED